LGGIHQEVAEHDGAASLEAGGVQLSRGERGDNGHPAPGACDCHVEAALTPLEIERTEAVEHPSVWRLAIADRQDDGVSFVALHPLQILHKESLVAILVEEPAGGRVRGKGDPQCLLDALCMPDAKRDDSQRLARPVASVRKNKLDDVVDLGLGGLDRPEARLNRADPSTTSSRSTDSSLVPGKVISAPSYISALAKEISRSSSER